MKNGGGNVVYDASALLCFFRLEAGSEQVKAELRACRAGRTNGWLSVVSLAEIAKRLRRQMTEEAVNLALQNLLLTPLRVAECDQATALCAGHWGHEAGVGVMDSIVAATASRLSARVITADPDFLRFGTRIQPTLVR